MFSLLPLTCQDDTSGFKLQLRDSARLCPPKPIVRFAFQRSSRSFFFFSTSHHTVTSSRFIHCPQQLGEAEHECAHSNLAWPTALGEIIVEL
jgi:hypothetical protein